MNTMASSKKPLNRFLSGYVEPETNESSQSESETEDGDLDIHGITKFGSLQELKSAIARDRPRLVALKDKVILFY